MIAQVKRSRGEEGEGWAEEHRESRAELRRSRGNGSNLRFTFAYIPSPLNQSLHNTIHL
jgi:hypothetical protein